MKVHVDGPRGLLMIAIALLIGMAADLPLTARVVEAAGTKYALEDAEFVVAGAAYAAWSPDGKKLAVHYFDPPNDALGRAPTGQKEVVAIWSVATKKFDGGSARFDGRHELDFKWEGSSSVIFELGGTYHRLNTKGLQKLSIDASSAQISTSADNEGALVADYAKVAGKLEVTASFVPAGLSEGRRIEPPEGAEGLPLYFLSGFYGQFVDRVKKVRKVVMFDPKSMSWITGAEEPGPRQPLFQIGTGQSMFRRADSPSVAMATGLWLVGDEKSRYPTALVAAKGSRGNVAATSDALSFFEGEVLFARQISKLSNEQLDRILETEEQMQLLSEAKQVGTAFHIFAADNDDRFPPASGWDDKIQPYVKNRQITDGFIYSYRGPEELTKLQEPSKEILGYKEGRFGRAVVYADGSARWERRKKL